MKKTCNNCQIEKELNEFYFRKDNNTYKGSCKECYNKKSTAYNKKNESTLKRYRKNYRRKNLKTIKDKNKKYRLENSEKIKQNNKKYRNSNKDKISNYRITHKERLKFCKRKRHNYRKKHDPIYKLRYNISRLILQAFKNSKKPNTTNVILGCSVQEFKIHLEKQFKPWMNWENHGRYNKEKKTWQLDHIIPISSATTKDELLKLNPYSNFQPLEAIDNILKSNN
jgi:hypothetical protein